MQFEKWAECMASQKQHLAGMSKTPEILKKTLVESEHVVYKIDDLDDTSALIPFVFKLGHYIHHR